MHPKGRVSPVQERQMTSVMDANVFNVAIEGTFDDCQAIMKALFNDLEFKDRLALGSVNSINWARVLAQLVYYFHAGLRVLRQTGARRIQFSVPTGNFGDIFAGYMAARMGLPISRLILATNENDILARFFRSGRYSVGRVFQTISPSMDIQVASNFERYLYYRLGGDPHRLKALMDCFAKGNSIEVPEGPSLGVDGCSIAAGSADTAATLETICALYRKHGVLIDPHTAVGVRVGMRNRAGDDPLICLATAHPAKFPAAIREALGADVAHHPSIAALAGLPTRCDTLPASAPAVREYIERKVIP
jgi:threonine synthase